MSGRVQANLAPPAGGARAGVRAVALLEAAKGALVVLVGFGALALVHRDLQGAAAQIVSRLHLNPARHTARVFLDAASHLDDGRLRLLALGAICYAALRAVEAYGLWRGQRWAGWLAAGTAAIYVPCEGLALARGFAWIKVAALAVNLLVVGYLVWVLAADRRAAASRRP